PQPEQTRSRTQRARSPGLEVCTLDSRDEAGLAHLLQRGAFSGVREGPGELEGETGDWRYPAARIISVRVAEVSHESRVRRCAARPPPDFPSIPDIDVSGNQSHG